MIMDKIFMWAFYLFALVFGIGSYYSKQDSRILIMIGCFGLSLMYRILIKLEEKD